MVMVPSGDKSLEAQQDYLRRLGWVAKIPGNVVERRDVGFIVEIGDVCFRALLPFGQVPETTIEEIKVGMTLPEMAVVGADANAMKAILSLKWLEPMRLQDSGETVQVRITKPAYRTQSDGSLSGFNVDICGLEGFLPLRFALSACGNGHSPQDRVGELIGVKVVKAQPQQRQLIVNEALARQEQITSFWDTVQEGQLVQGKVDISRVVDKGFLIGGPRFVVDIGLGIAAYLPKGEVTDGKESVDQIITGGQEINLIIVSVNRRQHELTLSLKRRLLAGNNAGKQLVGKVVSIMEGRTVQVTDGLVKLNIEVLHSHIANFYQAPIGAMVSVIVESPNPWYGAEIYGRIPLQKQPGKK